MRIALWSVIVLSPFVLSAVCAEEECESNAVPYALNEIADNKDYSSSAPSTESHSEPSCKSPFRVMHAGVRHTEARGIGYKKGYTTIEAFGIYDHNTAFMPFLDIRGHVFNNGKGAGNVGIGERTALFGIKHLLGVYFYYDVRQDSHGLTVNQVSPGIELVGSRMEYRLNGYFPVGGTRGRKYNRHFDKFQGNNIIAQYSRHEALKGGDGEVGVHITQSTTYDLYASAGAYYFNASESSWGGRTRLVGRYKEYVSLEASYSYDRLFKSVVQGTVGFNWPFGPKLKNRNRNCASEGRNLWFSRAAFSPQRFEIPVVKKIRHRYKAINPATGDPWQVVFVNNTSHSAGTYESPFPTIIDAEIGSAPNDMIYVFPGDGTTNGMNEGVILQDGQALFGSGTSHMIATTKGNLKIPSLTSTSPTITNLSGDVVSPANGNEISGLMIQVADSGASGIGNGLGVSNGVTITKNTITVLDGTNGSGINLGVSGNVEISQNLVSTTVSSGLGISLDKQDMANVDISKNNVSGFQVGIRTSGAFLDAPSQTVIQDNTVSGFALVVGSISQGILCSSDVQGPNIVINNVLTNTAGNRVTGISMSSVKDSVIENNIINAANAQSGITVFSLSNINMTTTVSNNILTGVNDGIFIQTAPSSTSVVCATIDGNQVSTSGVSPVAFDLISLVPGAVINIDSFAGNVGGPVTITNDVFFVEAGTCGQ
jgi:hypothetical protein